MNISKLASELVDKLIINKYTITTAESCTGGMVASAIVDVPGASSVFNEGHITYSNEAKMKYLGVKPETLEEYSAVSKETAFAMAMGVSELAKSNVSLAITGLAGPDGGTDEKPVGLVYMACKLNDRIRVEQKIFQGNRTFVREEATKYVLTMAIEMLDKKVECL